VGSWADGLHWLEGQAKVFGQALYPVDRFVGMLDRCGWPEYWQKIIKVMAKDGWDVPLDYPVECFHEHVEYIGHRLAIKH